MKLWVDDLRPAPEGWAWAKTSAEALAIFNIRTCHGLSPCRVLSLDHDLGGDDTTRRVVLWMAENVCWPDEVRVHTANPVGREWLEGMIARYKP